MSTKVAFISQARLSKLRLLSSEHQKTDWQVDFEVHEYIAEQNIQEIHELDKRRDIEVIIAGGGNAATIAAMQLDTPLVNIQISGFDVMQALWQAKRLAKTAVFINYIKPIEQLERYASLFTIKVEQYTFSGVADAIDTVLSVIQNPDNIVIGASHVCDIAQSFNAQSVFIYSQDAVNQALLAAEQLALSLSAQRVKREKLEAILNSVHDGIIYIDSNLKVEELNPAAQSILALNAQDSIGKPISEVIPHSELESVIANEKSQYNKLFSFGKTQVLCNRVAVFNQSKLIGAVASFQDVQSVRKAELSLHRETKFKNLVAKNPLSNTIGESLQIKRVLEKANHFAKTDASILIQGATGTGKELLAQGIHLASPRSRRPFVAFNCAAISETLLESTLFGYDEGAFTGASKHGKAGLFELANKGTIFLDEIGELPLPLQGRLLRVLQEREVMRLGSDTILPIDVRVIAATNKNLQEMTKNHTFKEDLYYRLNVLQLHLPTLAQRIDDLPIFIAHFFKTRSVATSVYEKIINPYQQQLNSYAWPGNIRELENLIERLSIMLNANMALDDIKDELLNSLSRDEQNVTEQPIQTIATPSQSKPLKEYSLADQQKIIQDTLTECHNNKALAAQKLGISRSTLWRKAAAATKEA